MLAPPGPSLLPAPPLSRQTMTYAQLAAARAALPPLPQLNLRRQPIVRFTNCLLYYMTLIFYQPNPPVASSSTSLAPISFPFIPYVPASAPASPPASALAAASASVPVSIFSFLLFRFLFLIIIF